MIRLLIDPEDREEIRRVAQRAMRTRKVGELHQELRALLSRACQECDVMGALAGRQDDSILLIEAELSGCVAQILGAWITRPATDIFRLLRVRLAAVGVWLVVRTPQRVLRLESRVSRGG